MAETEQVNAEKQEQENQAIDFDPKDNRFVFTVVLVDMDDKVRDVISLLHLCAPDPNQAFQRAGHIFQQQGLIKPDGRYNMMVGVVAPLPDSQPKVIRPRLELPMSVQKELAKQNG